MLYKNYYIPLTIKEAVAILEDSGDGAHSRPIAGGTDLMLQLHENWLSVDTLVDVTRIPEMKTIRLADGTIRIGAAVTYTDLIESETINKHAYILAEVSKVIGGAQIQHMGTIGGNIANASPAGDSLPALYAMDASITLTSVKGQRTLPLAEFIVDVRKTALKPGELITEIAFEALPVDTGAAFLKFAPRESQAISIVNAATVLQIQNNLITRATVALGSVAPIIVRSHSAEKMLLGQSPSPGLFEKAGEASRLDISPIDDIRGHAIFRRHITKPMVLRALETAYRRALQ